MTTLLIGLPTALAAAFVALIVAAVAAAPAGMPKADLLRVYLDLVRLLVSLSKDRQIARPVRFRLLVALIYNVQPINLIPNFIPVAGLADNVVITAWAVRSALRKSGAEVVLGHWQGSPASFILLCRLCHLHVPPELPAEWTLDKPDSPRTKGAFQARAKVPAYSKRKPEASALGPPEMRMHAAISSSPVPRRVPS